MKYAYKVVMTIDDREVPSSTAVVGDRRKCMKSAKLLNSQPKDFRVRWIVKKAA